MQTSPETLISANGIEICAATIGNPGDPAVLLIMGAGASMLLWRDSFRERLAAGGRYVIRYDNRDVGRTTSFPPGEPNYSLQTMADDAAAVLDHYGIGKAHIVGASMGGMIMQLVGLNHPDRVLTLTPIMSSPAGGAVVDVINGKPIEGLSPPTPEVLAAVAGMDNLDWTDRAAVVAHRSAMFGILAGPTYPFGAEEGEALFGAEFDRANNIASGGNHGICIGTTEPWAHRLGEINLPTLVIHGTADPILPLDHGQALAAGIPGAKMLELEGAGREIPDALLDTSVPAIFEHTA